MDTATLKIEALKLLLFILPGIITLRVKAALSISSPSKPLNSAIDGLVFTLLDHGIFGFLRWSCYALLPADVSRRLAEAIRNAVTSPSLGGDLAREFAAAGGFPMILISVVAGFAIGIVRYHGWDFWLLRRVRATNRTGENLVWAETLTKLPKPSYAVVACKDGSRFLGVVDTFSEEAGNYEILLSQAAQVQPDGSLLPIDGEGVLLTRENPITRVEFWYPRVEEPRREET